VQRQQLALYSAQVALLRCDRSASCNESTFISRWAEASGVAGATAKTSDASGALR
jgi:hypothetical protein